MSDESNATKPVVWSFPTRLIFGAGARAELPVEVKALGGTKVLVVTDPGVNGAGLVEPLVEALEQAGIGAAVFDGVSSNPLESELHAATSAYRDADADAIVAVGGGSPLDVGKLVKLTATHPMPLAQYDDALDGWKHITKPMPPMIAIPTTAGTGSEVGRAGVVTLQATHKKTVIFAPALMPNAAILDPELTVGLPPRTTAATGIDALTHCVEAYLATGDHPMADAIAFAGIELVAKHLETAVHDGKDLEARGAMLKAAMMGAVAFQKGLGACHALAHPLGAEYDLHHGLANALCLPAVLDFNRSAVPERVAQVAKLLGARGDDTETLAFECSGAVRALRKKVGLPDGLEAVDVPEDGLEKIAKLAMDDASHRTNPRPCTEEDMLSLLKASF
ncbi:MAG TPA: iron-containing alcohol dehydrogenase [Polyangiaceae bacterium LLY-WYZ-15_(1-7)]|nr:alcohol dehydrogenase [Sandaracinus sp.]HJK91296.1 iron-containing alcohol dehydrogenase [Polyangiaceae bacterium LLY-WYZ-15_(1-7)]MBJ74101.1 alcohol dehydrogenase [Sandaracinus sp.]HJL04189.1 iron-containing alcohol dehydrogenase [Polyangiaceae bacterium LLY-WYZ-15_(1-7)]HJL10427.1 iron-containing alcohol dehydrogenase [Polyangiaceae bacterium LLY-WYZ-15_(1-7)]